MIGMNKKSVKKANATPMSSQRTHGGSLVERR
jgi:hypothetical protein